MADRHRAFPPHRLAAGYGVSAFGKRVTSSKPPRAVTRQAARGGLNQRKVILVDYYATIISERNASEAADLLADQCRKKDREIELLIAQRDTLRAELRNTLTALYNTLSYCEYFLKEYYSHPPGFLNATQLGLERCITKARVAITRAEGGPPA